MELAMVDLASVRAYRQAILALASQHGARNVRLFGSVVRGDTHSRSDIDFLIDLDPASTLLDWSAFWGGLQQLLGRTVDVATESSLRPAVRDQALREAVPL
jgi:predicted nucleotidyltransferase